MITRTLGRDSPLTPALSPLRGEGAEGVGLVAVAAVVVIAMGVIAIMVAMVPMAVTNVIISVIMTRIYGRMIIHRRRRDHYWRRAIYGGWRDAQRRRRDDDSREGDPDIDSERKAGPRRGGAGGCEGDCYYGYCKYLFHTC